VPSDGKDHIRLKGHELGCQIWKSIQPTFRISVFDCNVSSFNIAQLAQTATDRRHLRVTLRITVEKCTEPPWAFRLRQAQRRPCCRTTDQRNELAPLHVVLPPPHRNQNNILYFLGATLVSGGESHSAGSTLDVCSGSKAAVRDGLRHVRFGSFSDI